MAGMPAHHLQPALDALDNEFHKLVLEHLEATSIYHERREALVQQIASSPTIAPDVPDHAGDILSQTMVADGETA